MFPLESFMCISFENLIQIYLKAFHLEKEKALHSYADSADFIYFEIQIKDMDLVSNLFD